MPHTLTDFADELRRPDKSARELGYRLPAEWEPVSRVWLTRPHNSETWPGDSLAQAQRQWDEFRDCLARVAEVCETRETLDAPTTDSWIRDYGPIFVVSERGELACHDFHFNGWGNKYESKDSDDVIPQHIARRFGLPAWIHDLTFEGGSIDTDGQGTLLTTEQCLLNKNRNPHLTREQIEAELRDAFAVTQIIWLPGGIEGDDTDGHVDDVARFIAPGKVAAVRAPFGHPDHEALEANWRALERARDAKGNALELIALPAPAPLSFDFPPDRFQPGGTSALPASYANFLIVNGVAFVPVFHQRSDLDALARLDRAMPDKQVLPIPADKLVIGMGALHCLSMQEPIPTLEAK